MFGIAARATASEIRQVWAEVEAKREEIYEEEMEYFEGLEPTEKQSFWGNTTNLILRRSKKLPVLRYFNSFCYRVLSVLTLVSVGLVMSLFVASAFADLSEMVKVAGKIATALLYAGVCVTGVAGFLYLWQLHNECLLRYQIAIQQILADEYNLATEYSEDVNSYAVLMLAANDLYFKTAKQVRAEAAKAQDEDDEEVFIAGTEEEVADAEEVGLNEERDEAGELSEGSESDDSE